MSKSKINYLKIAESLGYASLCDLLTLEYGEKEGVSTRDIGRLIGVSQNTARLQIRKCGIKLKARGGKNHKAGSSTLNKCHCGCGRPRGNGSTFLSDYCYKTRAFEFDRAFGGWD